MKHCSVIPNTCMSKDKPLIDWRLEIHLKITKKAEVYNYVFYSWKATSGKMISL